MACHSDKAIFLQQNTRIHIPKNKTNNIGLFFDFLLNTILNKISGVFLVLREGLQWSESMGSIQMGKINLPLGNHKALMGKK